VEFIASIISVTRISEALLANLMMGAYVHPKHRFLQEPHGVTTQNTAFFILTVMKTPNLT
jgi:hypothetical protein